MVTSKLRAYCQLLRLHRPIGILLVLWPTLTSLCLASGGVPEWRLLVIFSLGALIMRSAGCAINDFADRNFDKYVTRTKDRPLATAVIRPEEALIVFFILSLVALALVLMLSQLTIYLSFAGLVLAASYPLMKRVTHLAQLYLGVAMNWGIIMAYAEVTGGLDLRILLLFVATLFWTLVYDCFYAMVDRDDDRKLGLHSIALLLGPRVPPVTALLQVLCCLCLAGVGLLFELSILFYLALLIIALLFGFQQRLIRSPDSSDYFRAFMNNNQVGWVMCLGTLLALY